MKKVIKYLSLILIFLVSANMLCACTQKPWYFYDSIWCSEEPNLELYYDHVAWSVKITNGEQTENYPIAWGGGSRYVTVYQYDRAFSENNSLLKCEIKKYTNQLLILIVVKDKIWNNEYSVITLYRKPAN